MSRAYIAKAKRNDWLTPEVVLDAVRAVFQGPVGLDPCGNRRSLVQAKRQYLLSEGQDGLKLPWRGRVFVNPPFDDVATWLRKAHHESVYGPSPTRRGMDYECIFLMPSRTDTKAWHEVAPYASAICFWKGRLRFVGAPASAPFPTAFLYWGWNCSRFSLVFGERGQVVYPVLTEL